MRIQNYLSILIISFLAEFTTSEISNAAPLTLSKTSAVPKPTTVNPWMKLRLSKTQIPTPKKPDGSGSVSKLSFLAQQQEGGNNENAEQGGEQGGEKGEEKGGEKGGGEDGAAETEMALSLPRFVKNEKGEWVIAYWGATMGNVWRDTRFNIGGKLTIHPMRVDSKAKWLYYPRGQLSTVCVGRSTIYNVPRVVTWLKKGVATDYRPHRPIWTSLRRQIHNQGKADECHKTEFKKWREFMECSVRRHQRLEYLTPKYPLHQIGYRYNYYRPRDSKNN